MFNVISHLLSFMFIRSDLGYGLNRGMEFTHHKERDNCIRIPLCVSHSAFPASVACLDPSRLGTHSPNTH